MSPPGREPEILTTRLEVLVEATLANTDWLLLTTKHLGAAESVAEKGSVQAVTTPVPMVIVPAMSVPETLGLVPQEVGVPGVPSEPTGE